MNITKDNFIEKFSTIAGAILEADCIAIDAEFSGLRLNTSIHSQFDDQQARYGKLRDTVKEYSIIQYGVCTFKKGAGSRVYVAKPFNFYIFGGDTATMTSQRSFLCSASSLQFLRSHNFDFNKWIDYGIPFYNFAETSTVVKRIDRPNSLQNPINLQMLTKQQMKFVETTRKSIDDWLQSGKTSKPLVIQTNNSFIRRLVHQELQEGKYNSFLTGRMRDSKHMSIHKLTDEERKENMRVDNVQAELNFRRVIELINQAGCPVVAHNGYLDVLHTIDQFWQYLPTKVTDFKNLANEMWSCIVDTKYLAEFHPHLKRCFNTTALGPLYNTVVNEMTEAEFSIKIADDFDRYTQDQDAQHEAGYDAYMTGSVFIGFARFIYEREADKRAKANAEASLKNGKESKKGSDLDSEEEEEEEKEEGQVGENEPLPRLHEDPLLADILTSYYNRIFVTRSDIPYIDLVHEETMPVIEVPNRFFLTNVPEGMTAYGIEVLYPELRPMTIHWINSSSAWLIIKHDNKIELAKEGVLGEERVKPFLRGASRFAEGVSLNITAPAAKIELYGYEQWRTRPEFQADASSSANGPAPAPAPASTTKTSEEEEEESSSVDTASGSDEDEEEEEKEEKSGKSPKDTSNTLERKQAATTEPYVPVGGNAFDDIDIPMPPSFMRGSKRKAPDDDLEDEENEKKSSKKRQ
ncbi:ribonuclease H-like domain-containing protein [Zychaea mexicana]|uniref:ribonuclease H-like domain-containing protein n=1 Tax=Zychaea mexicana TaxID=64656 RepID=UPI0022FE2FC0|nr:ribonuclease H-like domain-containing protein [Zychaea mexicana]KAI9490361.1 ribonuclease H-like domain-containing protein [Zychaea mexicana]